MTAYYNENDPKAAAWLRELIKHGHIAPGEVDERSIVDIRPKDLKRFSQCHFFAGIGGWSRALRLAGWPDDRPVWTGSCPCQPFSAAGKGAGFADERHLWPYWHYLIEQCRPATIFGEQVASSVGLAWLDHVCADLESAGYAAAATNIPACGVGAPHERQRLWWIADANPNRYGLEAHADKDVIRRQDGENEGHGLLGEVGLAGQWDTARPVGARPMAVDNGVPSDMGRLRAYGNAIVPQVAAAFILAYKGIFVP